MKKFIALAIGAVLFFTACKKSPLDNSFNTHPEMMYTDLSGSVVGFNQYKPIDLDKDGHNDVGFGTMLVGDPVNKQDKKQWLVTTSFYTSLPVNPLEGIPVLALSDLITIGNMPACSWYNASGVVLAQKIIEEQTTYWLGDWKNANHRYIAIQVNKNGQLYNGWVEISFDPFAEQIVLHRAAIASEPNKNVKAGW